MNFVQTGLDFYDLMSKMEAIHDRIAPGVTWDDGPMAKTAYWLVDRYYTGDETAMTLVAEYLGALIAGTFSVIDTPRYDEDGNPC